VISLSARVMTCHSRLIRAIPATFGFSTIQTTVRHDEDRMPLAVQWGGHILSTPEEKDRQSYAMGTCLSTALNQLDLDLIRNWDYELPEYWGAVGHYTIANIVSKYS
jgi:hypothetical protein